MRRAGVVGMVGLLLAGILALPARAGTGVSQWCGDDFPPGNEIHILNSPITLNLESGSAPPYTYLLICFSTTSSGSTAPTLVGGIVELRLEPGYVLCRPDANTVLAVTCDVGNFDGLIGAAVSVRFQETVVNAAVTTAGVGGPACIRDVSVVLPTGPLFPPFDLGACA